jgi:hypothetical protein
MKPKSSRIGGAYRMKFTFHATTLAVWRDTLPAAMAGFIVAVSRRSYANDQQPHIKIETPRYAKISIPP